MGERAVKIKAPFKTWYFIAVIKTDIEGNIEQKIQSNLHNIYLNFLFTSKKCV